MENLTPKYVYNDRASDGSDTMEPRDCDVNYLVDRISKSIDTMERVIKVNIDAMEKHTADVKSEFEAYIMVNQGYHGASASMPCNVYSGYASGSNRSFLQKVNYNGATSTWTIGQGQQCDIDNLTPTFIMSFTENLAEIMKHHADVVRQLQTDKGVPSLKTDRMFLVLTDDDLLVSRFSVLYTCPNCDKDVKAVSITRHMASQQCLVDTANRDVRTGGYQELMDPKHTNSIIKANVGAQPRPKEYQYWVPQWVNEAVEQFQKRGGFAGLSLSEYLSKLAEEKRNN